MTDYQISTRVAIELFVDKSLVLVVPRRQILTLAPFEAAVIKGVAAGLTQEELLDSLRTDKNCPSPFTAKNLSALLIKLEQDQVLVKNSESQPGQGGSMITEKIQYLRDPDVVIREEDPEEGAILFHPDTNQVKILNASGFFIWQQCGQPATQEEITNQILTTFEEVPQAEIANDVAEFLKEMLAAGFIGIVAPSVSEE